MGNIQDIRKVKQENALKISLQIPHKPQIAEKRQNIRRSNQGETATTAPTAAGTVPAYQATHFGGGLMVPRGLVATAINNIILETQRKIQETYSIS